MSTCVDSLSLALGQISFAVSDLTKKNYKATLKEIHEVSFNRKGLGSCSCRLYMFVTSLLCSTDGCINWKLIC